MSGTGMNRPLGSERLIRAGAHGHQRLQPRPERRLRNTRRQRGPRGDLAVHAEERVQSKLIGPRNCPRNVDHLMTIGIAVLPEESLVAATAPLGLHVRRIVHALRRQQHALVLLVAGLAATLLSRRTSGLRRRCARRIGRRRIRRIGGVLCQPRLQLPHARLQHLYTRNQHLYTRNQRRDHAFESRDGFALPLDDQVFGVGGAKLPIKIFSISKARAFCRAVNGYSLPTQLAQMRCSVTDRSTRGAARDGNRRNGRGQSRWRGRRSRGPENPAQRPSCTKRGSPKPLSLKLARFLEERREILAHDGVEHRRLRRAPTPRRRQRALRNARPPLVAVPLRAPTRSCHAAPPGRRFYTRGLTDQHRFERRSLPPKQRSSPLQ